MIAVISSLLANKRARSIVSWAGAIMVRVALLWAAVTYISHDAVHDALAKRDAADQVRAIEADRRAAAVLAADRARNAQAEKELTDAAQKGDASPVGPGTRAVIDRVREQQAAPKR